MGFYDLFRGRKKTLHDVVARGELVALRAALKKQKDVDAKNEEGLTPLQLACQLMNPILPASQLQDWIKEQTHERTMETIYEMMRALLGHGANPNILFPPGPSGRQRTVLEMAIHSCDEIAILLIHAGADVNHEGEGGWSPLALARRLKNESLADLLLQFGAQENEKSLEIRRENEEQKKYLESLDPKGDLRITHAECAGEKEFDRFLALLKPISTLVIAGHDLRDLSLTPGQRLLYVADEVEAEVHNGGFDQYFFNSSGDHAGDAAAALKHFGAKGKSALMQRALNIFPGGVCPTDREERWDLADKIAEDKKEIWNTLDTEYYDFDRTENLLALALNYAGRNPEEFFRD